MKRILSLIAAFVLCFTMAASVVSAEEFVPSITYKDAPEVENAVLGAEEKVENCIVVTSILAAQEKTTDIAQASRDFLLETYDDLKAGKEKLPMPSGYVVRELVDVSFKGQSCVGGGHTHQADLNKENVSVSVVFELGVKKNANVVVVHYHDGKWTPAKSVKNNGDGTVTVEMEHFCPVAFCVEAESGPAQTGDEKGNQMTLWIVLLVVSLLANLGLLAYLFLRMKKKKK